MGERRFFASVAVLGVAGTLIAGCPDPTADCELNPKLGCGPYAGGNGPGGSASGAGGQGGAGGGAGGSGGAEPCGGACADPTPLCDPDTNTCVVCLGSADCTSPASSRCEAGSCVPCQGAADCTHLGGLGVCDGGSCVECALGDESACGGPSTCDLLAKTCTGPAEGAVMNCAACTNDLQCQAGHRCIQMDFQGSHHGYYCLKEPDPSCARPFAVPLLNRPSLSSAPAADYCGIEEDLATCEAVLALVAGWVCTGTDGMCSPDGIEPEQAVPGAVCRQVGFTPDQCTYACDATPQCPLGSPQNTCGDGDNTPPGWCGG